MRTLRLRLAVLLFTFTIGVLSTSLTARLFRAVVKDVPFAASPKEPIAMPAIPSCFPGASLDLAKTKDSRASYFPPGIADQRQSDQFRANWYSQHLDAMQEPSLLSLSSHKDETYRFLWLRSFHHPVAVRVWRLGNQSFLTVKELSGAGGFKPGEIMVDRTRRLSEDQWLAFTRLLEASCFWALPTRGEMLGNDGAQWIVEGKKEGRYHMVDRWSPDHGDYRETCLYLLKISGLGIDEKSKDLY